jgi:UDP-N-acetylmuramoyl-tripeptide--D-alanyl-D-alanine ligase
VKELLAQLLSNSYRVASTPKNVNSDIGISRFILSTDFSKIDVCIVEMGAYNRGDIKLVCDIVHPTIGILTAINQQHLSLFGSIENIQTTKYELLKSIPKTGVSITNADNRLCMQYAKELESTVLTFGSEPENNPICLIESAEQVDEKLEIKYLLQLDKTIEKMSVTASVIGEHQSVNIAPCILVAKTIGMPTEKIISSVDALKQPAQSIKIFTFGKATIIDDSYNSNPDGFKAALQLLGTFPSEKKRIVITRGMHELGSESSDLHERIGNEISFFADELIIITPDFAADLERGVLEKYQTTTKEIFDTEELVNFVKNLQNEDVVILIENRVPAPVRSLYLK